MPKTAEIIAVGSELLTAQRMDTDSLIVTEHVNLLGVEVVAKQVIGDDRDRLAEAVRTAVGHADVVILIGGLGPTEDDVTREAVALALGRKLSLDLHQESVLIARFRQINRPMAKNNLKQAYMLEGAEAMPNPLGTAPGQFLSTHRGALALLPGPPRELRAMVENELVPRLRPVLPLECIRVRTFRITGIGESDLDALIAPVYTKYTNPSTTVLSSPGDLFVHLRARAESLAQADAMLRAVGNPIADLLGERVYSEDAHESLEMVIGRLLRKKHATVAAAESCTGGMVTTRLTDQPGSSDFFIAGYVTYSDAQKSDLLGIPRQLIETHTAVSEAVASAMAEGARKRSGAAYAISTTGYAGPDGGTPFNPVGTVFLAVSGPNGTRVVRTRHMGDRWRIRTVATQAALDLLRLTLLH